VRRRQLANIVLAGCETAQHRASSPIGERVKHAVERGGAFLGHTLERTTVPAEDQPLGLIADMDPC